MLRVSSLGLSLPASTNNSQPFRLFVSPWEPPYRPTNALQVRRASNSTGFPQARQGKNEVDEGHQGPKRLFKLGPRGVESWKSRFIRQEIRHKYIRPLRPIQTPPKYARPPERLGKFGGKSVRAESGVPRIVVHPVHRSSRGIHDGTVYDPLLEEIPPEEDAVVANEAGPATRKRHSRDALLRILAGTHLVSDAWDAYSVLLAKHSRPSVFQDQDPTRTVRSSGAPIPYAHLHRLARLLSSTRPRTRELFLRLLSVLTTIRSAGGTVLVWEWNALIDCAGKGWRKTNIEDYRAALGIFKDMVASGQASSSTPSPSYSSPEHGDPPHAYERPVAQPDIISFTTLLHIASRSYSETAIIHAISLLNASELPWNHVTHMARLQYFVRNNQLEAVRNILRHTVHRGLDLYTLNGCMWAFARCGRLSVALEVYELLRSNIPTTDRADLDELPLSASSDFVKVSESYDENPILNLPGFILPRTMRPDRVTYIMLIQALCYHGDLFRAVMVFRDMISTVDPATRPRHPVGRPEEVSSYYTPSLVIYRAIFLGFARHTHTKLSLSSSLTSRRRYVDIMPLPEFAARLTPSGSGFGPMKPSLSQEGHNLNEAEILTLENLDAFFESFLDLDWDHDAVIGEAGIPTRRPSDRMIYWIMVAYAKVTKRDVGKMYKIWQRLDVRFGYGEDAVSLWGGRLARIAAALGKRQEQFNAVEDDGTEIDPNG